jgi:D-glycero-D-manno-heptose 1,7-bisphosphate phosphatase
MSERYPAVFLDRDDTLIRNIPYLGDPRLVELLPGVPEALRMWQKEGWRLAVTSNQSGVGRGLISVEQVTAVNAAMLDHLGWNPFVGIYNCYLAPGQPGADRERKPSPYLLQQAAEDHHLDLARSWMIGDRDSDILAGQNAGCRTALVLNGRDPSELDSIARSADFIAHHLDEVAAYILRHPDF